MTAGGASPSIRAATYRLVLMSWCWNFLVDFLWITLVAYAQDLGLRPSTTACIFACNLGARLVPNLAATLFGIRSEFAMMACTFAGYAASFVRPTEVWALYLMASCAGMGFVRACLTLHPALVFGDDCEQLAKAAKYCGAARNLGTLTALVLPAAVYRLLGWPAVCALGMAAVLLYTGLAAAQHWLFGGRSSPAPQPAEQLEEGEPAARASIPWIMWVLGAAFVVLELQMNICNAAVPTALTQTFGLPISTAGHFLAASNGASMCFLAWLPSAPRWMKVLHKSPLNILLAFLSIFAAWCAAVVATVYPLGGLGIFIPGILIFMMAAFMAQVLMMECLTGVLDVHESKVLMGVSETIGCGFAALGGYLGDELEVYGAAAPFALQASVALLTFSTLAGALGHRLVTQLAAQGPPPAAVTETCEGCLRQSLSGHARQSLSGLKAMKGQSDSFVHSEREYLRWSSRSLSQPLLAPGAAGEAAAEEAAAEEHAAAGSVPAAAAEAATACPGQKPTPEMADSLP